MRTVMLSRIRITALVVAPLLIQNTIAPPAHATDLPQEMTSIRPSQEQFQANLPLAKQLLELRRLRDEVEWSPEVDAQKHEAVFTELWDSLLNRDDKFKILANFPTDKVKLGKYTESDDLELGITHHQFTEGGEELTPDQWAAYLATFKNKGYQIDQTEWHHQTFTPGVGEKPAESNISFTLHVSKAYPGAHRVIIRGKLDVIWSPPTLPDGKIKAKQVLVKNMEIYERSHAPIFQQMFTISGTDTAPRILPLLVNDLNNDGSPDIYLGGQNMILWNNGKGQFNVAKLLKDERSIYDSAVLADFNGDGHLDLVAVDTTGRPTLFASDQDGHFNTQGIAISDIALKQPKVFTAGDIDGDGDNDLFIANYKFPYRQGQWPSPYYNANDGYPAYLFRNDGNGKFTDITEQSGLAAKRFRRAFSGSFVDLDDDNDLDLLLVSDFAGMDVFINNGSGVFKDVTDTFGLDAHSFGMGLTFADYNRDGKLDFYVIGMSSTTARRLESMGLGLPNMDEYTAMRKVMGYGNRMFLANADSKNGFILNPMNSTVARTGWSWGVSSFDFDNDGDKDIFVANGHVSGKSTEDYCTTFWRHDIYTEGSEENVARDILFQTQSSPLRKADISWNGYEHKAMLMNRGDKGFVNVSYLLGTSFEYDGRGVVATDLDSDGRVDLMVVEYKSLGEYKNNYVLHVYKNIMDDAGNWVGVKLKNLPGGHDVIGAKILLYGENGKEISQIVTGDSFSSQHPAVAHFGIGSAKNVSKIEVHWLNGDTSVLENPEINKYHLIGLEDKTANDSQTQPPETSSPKQEIEATDKPAH